jgi:glycosyltransferase involved in cell wall biosynthesis
MRILWIPHIAWRIPQRAHLFCHALAEKHEVHVTDLVADFYTPRDYFSRRYPHNFIYRQYWDGKIRVHGVPRVSPALFWAALRRLNTVLFQQLIARLVGQYRIDVVVGTYVVPPPKAPRLIFDLFDDNPAYWRSFGRNLSLAREIERVEAAYLHLADAIVAASSVLADKARIGGAGAPVTFIPNGVELSMYKNSDGRAWREKFGAGDAFVGVLGNHDKLVELEKVLLIAKELRSFVFVIAGRGTALPAARRRAKAIGLHNVIFTGPMSRQEGPNLLAALDVGLCPYQKTPGGDAGSPMRLLQYSAAGLPVVCTNLEEVSRMNFRNVVRVDDNVNAFIAGIRQAVIIPKGRPSQLMDYDLPLLVSRWESILRGDAV